MERGGLAMRARWAHWGALGLSLGLFVGCQAPEELLGGADAGADLVDLGRLQDAEEALSPYDAAAPVDAAPLTLDATAPIQPLVAEAGPDHAVAVGTLVRLDGARSTGARRYRWRLGDGRSVGPAEQPVAEVRYDVPGRYAVTLTVFDEGEGTDSDEATVTVTAPVVHRPTHDNTVAAVDPQTVVTLSTDASALVVVDAATLAVRGRVPVCQGPRRLASLGPRVAVTCPSEDTVLIVDLDAPGTQTPVRFRYGAAPFGVIGVRDRWYVALQGTGELVALQSGPTGLAVAARWPVGADPRGLAALPDGRVAITHWRADAAEGRITVVDPVRDAVARWSLPARDEAPPAMGGVPTWLDQLVVSPTGLEAVAPAMLADPHHGVALDGAPVDFERATRGVAVFLDPVAGPVARVPFEAGRGLASAAAWSARGDYLYVAFHGGHAIERLDRLGEAPARELTGVGAGIEGLLVFQDRLWVEAGLSRSLVVYPLGAFDGAAAPLARVPLVEVEPLEPRVLAGKRLFNDATDPRLSGSGLACAHCHLDGDADRLVWDWTDRGEGLRNTIPLLGRAGVAHGPLFWSGRADEVQDVEHDLRGAFGGAGLMSDAAFAAFDRPDPPGEDGEGADDERTGFGAPTAGVSGELDALAAYLGSLDRSRRSPHRAEDGGLSPRAQRGAAVFLGAGCARCHPGPLFTDSGVINGAPLLHDVGTLGEGSGQRLGGPLRGLDTPTLIGLWDHAPYLHDGSAPTLGAVLTRRNSGDVHGTTTGLSPDDLGALEAYLLSLDGSEGPR